MQHQRVAGSCIALVFLGAVLLAVGAPVGRLLPLALALACPLTMVFMMRGMHRRHGGDQQRSGAAEG
jgi:hypothetical protein